MGGDLFPTRVSFVVFVAYMLLFVNHGLLVTASKTSTNTYTYSIITVVLLTECCKLVVSTILYMKDHTFSMLKTDFIKHRRVLMFYFVPAFLYCLYNNLQFVNLAVYDPTTYFLLLQFRVAITGVVFQFLFKKRLSCVQWCSLLLLTAGCVVKEVFHHISKVGAASIPAPDSSVLGVLKYIDIHLVFMLIQVFCSVFAGVYNEYLLKDTGCDVHIMMQNIFMYVDSIVCNVFVVYFRRELFTTFSSESISAIFSRPIVVAIVVNSTAIGIVTSLFLRNLNSILKTFASAFEILITAVLSWIIFGIPIDVYTVIAIVIVSISIYIYAQNPVVNKAKNEIQAEAEKIDKV